MDITEVKDLVWKAFKQYFPTHVGYTWFLTLWMDDTFKVTLRHGEALPNPANIVPPPHELHMFTWYNNKITYTIKGGINLNTIIKEEIL